MRVEPGKGRAKINDSPNSLVVMIPAKRRWFLVLFLTAWLGGWAFGETSAVSQLLNHESKGGADGFLLFWLVGWTLGGAFAFMVLAWMLAGNERVVLSASELQIRREILGYGFGREFDLQHVENLRALPTVAVPFGMNGLEFWGLAGGAIAFDYGKKTERFGVGLDESEAREIAGRIRSVFGFNGGAA